MAIANRKSEIGNLLGVLGVLGGSLLLAVSLSAGEMIYLQDGKEYYGSVQAISEGELRAQIGGKEQSFALPQIQRIEFQRPREYDAAQTAADLAKASPFFAEILKTSSDDLARKFPQAGYLVLADETVVTLSDDGRYVLERTVAWRILQERGDESAASGLYYFPDRQKVAVVYGLTVAPDGSVARVADTAMKDEALYARVPAYNFRHRLRFNLKNAVPGATLLKKNRLEGRATLADPLVTDRVFWDTEPALSRSVRLVASPKTRAQVAVATANGLQATDGLWEAKDTPQILREPTMPPFAVFSPRLVLAWPRASWPEVAREITRRLGTAKLPVTPGATPQALYDRVRLQVRTEDVPLDALPDGPAPPATVLARGYGNEVERALLLAALLRSAGHQAETLVVRDRDAGPLLASVPRARGFDYGVVRLTEAGGRVTWLQPDDDLRGFGELAPDVQGSEALNLDTGEIATVPVLAPPADSERRTVEVQLAPDGTAEVRDAYALRGNPSREYRALKGYSAAELQKWAARFAGADRVGVELLDFKHSDFSRANPVESLSFTYRIPSFAEKAGPFFILRLPNAALSTADVGRSTRERDLFWDGTELEETTFVVRAPAGHTVYAVAEPFERKGDGWSVASRFVADPAARGVVRFEDRWERTALTAPREAYAAYREARIRRSQLRGETIVFVKE